MKSAITLLFAFGLLLLPKNDIIVNEHLNVARTYIIYNGKASDKTIWCADRIKGDTISIIMGAKGLEGFNFNLKLVNEIKKIQVFHWSDYGQFDGQPSVEAPIKNFRLEINKNIFKCGDTLKAKFFIKTEEDRFSNKMKLQGEVFHIIGDNAFMWGNDEHYYQNKRYKNGFAPVKQVNDSV